MSDWNRYPGDEFRRRPPLADDDGGYGGPRGEDRGQREDRSFERGAAGSGPRPHRGYRLGTYGARSSFGGPSDYIEPGYGYGGETFAGGGYDRGYGEDRSGGVGRGAYGRAPEGRSGGGGPAFEGGNERLRRVADGEADHGHFFGGGAQHVHGEHRGRGPKGYSRSDERIRDDVADRLTADSWLDATDIEVAVKDGEVTLGGHVRSRDDKRRAESLAEDVLGVKHVQNNLRVAG